MIPLSLSNKTGAAEIRWPNRAKNETDGTPHPLLREVEA